MGPRTARTRLKREGAALGLFIYSAKAPSLFRIVTDQLCWVRFSCAGLD